MATVDRAAARWDGGQRSPVRETLAVEAALQINVNGAAFTTTMRTPGADEALARGLLHTEAILPADAPASAHTKPDPETGYPALIEIECEPALVTATFEGRRSLMATSSCGLCGTREARDLALYGPAIALDPGLRLPIGAVADCMAAMAAAQADFRASGGCHAAAVFDVGRALLAVHEDVGRHNAVDKCVGALGQAGRLPDAAMLTVSGRLSYEIVFKAYRAGLPIIAAVSAPSSLAVESAEQLGITLLAFCRDRRATVYSCPERIEAGASGAPGR